METHDRYDRDILKALQSIAKSLDKIERHISTMDSTSANTSDYDTPGTDA